MSLKRTAHAVFPTGEKTLADLIGVFYRVGNGVFHTVPGEHKAHHGSFRPDRKTGDSPFRFMLTQTQERALKKEGARIKTVAAPAHG